MPGNKKKTCGVIYDTTTHRPHPELTIIVTNCTTKSRDSLDFTLYAIADVVGHPLTVIVSHDTISPICKSDLFRASIKHLPIAHSNYLFLPSCKIRYSLIDYVLTIYVFTYELEQESDHMETLRVFKMVSALIFGKPLEDRFKIIMKVSLLDTVDDGTAILRPIGVPNLLTLYDLFPDLVSKEYVFNLCAVAASDIPQIAVPI
jgi:hypothetical protein